MKIIHDSNLLREALDVFKKLIFSLSVAPESEWKFYESHLTLTQVDKGEFYLQPGDSANIYAFVFKGLFKRYYLDENGNPTIFSFDGPGRAISDLPSLLRKVPANMFIEALQPSLLLCTPPGFSDVIRNRHESFHEGARKITELRYLEFVDRTLDLLTLSAENRYKKFMEFHRDISDEIEVRDIAAYVGVKPETLSRIRKLSSVNN